MKQGDAEFLLQGFHGSRVVTMQHWLTDTEFTDIISIAEMTPGPLGINIASFVGTRTVGIPGTLIATLSYVFPAMVIVILLAILYDKYRGLRYVKGVLKGLHPAVAAMVVAVILSLIFLCLLQKKKLGPIQTILGSGVVGAVIYGLLGSAV